MVAGVRDDADDCDHDCNDGDDDECSIDSPICPYISS